MRKYWALIKVVFQDQISYPAEVFYQLTLSLLPLLMMSFLWLTVYKTNSSVAGFNLPAIVTYYLLIIILGRFQGHAAFWVSDMIEDGRMSGFIVKPFHFLKYIFVHSFSVRAVNLLMSLPVIVVVCILLRQYILVQSDLILLTVFLLASFLAIIIFYLMGMLIGLISFWTHEIGSIFYFYYGLLNFLGGGLLPLYFYPEVFRKVLDFMPFKFIYFFPAQVYLGKIVLFDALISLSIGLVWVVVLYVLVVYVWILGIKRYSAFGG